MAKKGLGYNTPNVLPSQSCREGTESPQINRDEFSGNYVRNNFVSEGSLHGCSALGSDCNPFVRAGLWQNREFLRILSFCHRIFFRGFRRRSFSPRFCGGKKVARKSCRKTPAKSTKIHTTRIPNIFLQKGRANLCCCGRV